jgi:hypothetical protein
MISDLQYASLVIPKIIVDASDLVNRDTNILRYQPYVRLNNSFLFYSELFHQPNTWIDYDYFNFIPLTYDEIIMYVYCSNQFDTLLKNKISNLINKLIYNP